MKNMKKIPVYHEKKPVFCPKCIFLLLKFKKCKYADNGSSFRCFWCVLNKKSPAAPLNCNARGICLLFREAVNKAIGVCRADVAADHAPTVNEQVSQNRAVIVAVIGNSVGVSLYCARSVT